MTNIREMKMQILFAHSGGEQGSIGKGSFDLVTSLRDKLGNRFEIICPIIDDPAAPTYAMWKSLFTKAFSKGMSPLILIGHSLGGSMILKYLSEERPDISIAGLFLVATPHWGKGGWDVADFVLRKNFNETLTHIPIVYLYQCVQDKIVPVQHLEFYRKAFPAAKIRELPGKDHAFAKGLPELVNDIKSLL